MRNNDRTWILDKNGSIVFKTMENVVKKRYSSKSIFERSSVAIFVMILCAVLDSTLFYQLLSKALYDSPATMYATTIGLLIGFDYAPC